MILFQLLALVTDGGGLSSTLSITITIIRNNDCPRFSSDLRQFVIEESSSLIDIIKLEDIVTDNDPNVSAILILVIALRCCILESERRVDLA